MLSLLTRWFGDAGTSYLKSYARDLEKIGAIEEVLQKELTSEVLIQEKTRSFMARFDEIDRSNPEAKKQVADILEEIKLEAIATHRIACRLLKGTQHTLDAEKVITWEMVPYDVQILGGLALHHGNIAEMRTGEGKTLVATIAAYVNALSGSPVHVVTVNDYLARRDATEMGILYRFLGLSVGVVTHRQGPTEKKQAYSSNIVYATNNELGFDYLRENMAPSVERRMMSPLTFAIVDEVDSILVDEARTPLIISAPDSEPTSKYTEFASIARRLTHGVDYKIDEKQKTATLTEDGIRTLEGILGVDNIYLSERANDVHHIENALKAVSVYKRDIDYLVRDDEVLIIDEHTGRVLAGRRYSDGLHQALEAKEGVSIQQESRTLASITFQNFFRLYDKLAGMTGTAKTEEEEFYKIYRLTVVTIPTNRPMIRHDLGDLLFKNEKGKYAYCVKLIQALHEKGQPVLVGTVSVAKSEYLSELLNAEGISHNVLNAKQDAREAEIVGNAGQWGAVTIATNMAGRGTDIKLDAKVAELSGVVKVGTFEFPLGGLFVIGTEKHETRRIDNQLRGRSGRQGDPGASQFMVSPQDDIMRIFGGDKLFSIFNSSIFASIPDDEPLNQSNTLTKRISSVQKQVEGRNFDIRKHVLEYDDVLNQHRVVMYGRRKKVLENEDVNTLVKKMFGEYFETLAPEYWDTTDEREEAIGQVVETWNALVAKYPVTDEEIRGCQTREDLISFFDKKADSIITTLSTGLGEASYLQVARHIILQSMDELWMEHIDSMAHLREEVAFEGYAQKNPLVVYKERSYEKFVKLMNDISFRMVRSIGALEVTQAITVAPEYTGSLEKLEAAIDSIESAASKESEKTIRISGQKPQGVGEYSGVGRNDPCPCGSGKKFKHCHGK